MRTQDEIIKIKEGVFTAPTRWAKTWEELGSLKGAYVDDDSQIYEINYLFTNLPDNKHIFATEEQANQFGIVAAQLSQLVAQLNGEQNWKSSESAFKDYYYHVCMNNLGELFVQRNPNLKLPFPIKTEEAAEFSLKYHANLWRKFWGS